MNTIIRGSRDPRKMANPRLKTIALGQGWRAYLLLRAMGVGGMGRRGLAPPGFWNY